MDWSKAARTAGVSALILGLSSPLLAQEVTPRSSAPIAQPVPAPSDMIPEDDVASGTAGAEGTTNEGSPAGMSEDEEFIETDRNSFTFARMTAGNGRLIVESSYSYINLSGEKIKNSFPELLMRYGIGDRFELRLGWNYETGHERKPDAGDIAGFFGANAEQQIYYGFKAALSRQSGWIPGSAFLAQGHTPTGGPQSNTQLRTGYVMGWMLPNRWDIDAAFRFGTDNDEGRPYVLWAPSAVLKIPLTPSERWFTHVEYFGVITNGKNEDTSLQFVDIGLHHLITPNMEIGGIVAFGPHGHGLDLVTNFGIGIRF